MKKKSARKIKISLMKSVEAGDVAAVRAAVASGQELLGEMEDTSPLAVAVEGSNMEMAKALLELGHKPDLGGIVVPLALAAQNGNLQIVELLLNHGANVNEPGEEGETALMWAASVGHLEIVKRLIVAGASIKQTDRDGEDVLSYAVRGASSAVVDFVLPHFPKARQEKVARQAHLRETKPKKESALFTQLQEAVSRPEPKSRKSKAESLIHAYSSGETEKFLQLLAAGADPNETNKEGTTILGLVASSSVFDLLEPLLSAGANPNRGKLFRPLKSAAFDGVEPVRLLLKAGADVDWADADGDTALMSAAASGDEDVVQLLLDAGANPNAENHDGQTAYGFALEGNNRGAAELLAPLTASADDARRPWRKNKEGKSHELCLIDAADGGDVEHVKKLIADGVNVDAADESGDTALHHAASNGNDAMISLLLKASAPLEALGCSDHTPLLAAAARGRTSSVQILLKAGADIRAGEGTVLCYACENDDCLALVEFLLKSGAKVNVSGGHRQASPLHVAAEKNHVAVARRLLEAGAKINAKDPNGWTPFLTAALRSGVELVKLLIDAGSDIKAIDRERRNAYDLASKWGKREVAEFLKPLFAVRK